MQTDVVIATYNRPKSLEKLVKSLIVSKPAPQRIIVVDSSPEENKDIQQYDCVNYVRSSHPNQPYQRFLGVQASEADIIVFLDDDMEVLEYKWLEYVIECFKDDVVGVALNFRNDNDFLQKKLPKTKLKSLQEDDKLKRFLKTITGIKQPEAGKFWLCGIRGLMPYKGGEIEWVSGGAFAARRTKLYKNFNFRLFDLFEHKVGMGEDALLGFTLVQQGKIIYLDDEFFYHNDQKDSTYTVDFYSYGKRVAYSRLYLSFEYARLTQMSKLIAFSHFVWYAVWRLLGMMVNLLLDYKASRVKMLRGYFAGSLKALKDVRSLSSFDEGSYWKKKAQNDSK